MHTNKNFKIGKMKQKRKSKTSNGTRYLLKAWNWLIKSYFKIAISLYKAEIAKNTLWEIVVNCVCRRVEWLEDFKPGVGSSPVNAAFNDDGEAGSISELKSLSLAEPFCESSGTRKRAREWSIKKVRQFNPSASICEDQQHMVIFHVGPALWMK